MRRGAGGGTGAAACGRWGIAGTAGVLLTGGALTGLTAGGAAVTAGRTGAGEEATGGGAACTGGGVAAARAAGGADSASLRSWIALSTSPGLDTRDQSIFGLGSWALRAVLDEAPREPPPLIYARRRSASSASTELEWVFFSVTPIAVSASSTVLLFTSNSRAKSLIRTLLIRPFYACTLHNAVRCASQPRRCGI